MFAKNNLSFFYCSVDMIYCFGTENSGAGNKDMRAGYKIRQLCPAPDFNVLAKLYTGQVQTAPGAHIVTA